MIFFNYFIWSFIYYVLNKQLQNLQCILCANEMKCFAIDFLSVNTVRYDFSDKSRVFKMLPALDRILF